MSVARFAEGPRVRVCAITCLSFLLASTGWLSWLYHLTELASPGDVDFLTMVVGYLMQAVGMAALAFMQHAHASFAAHRYAARALAGYVACLAPATMASNIASTLAFGYLANVLCGFVQGYYLLCLTRSVEAEHRGKTFGFAYATSTLASWLLSLPVNGSLMQGAPALVLCTAMALSAFFALRDPMPPLEDTSSNAEVESAEAGNTTAQIDPSTAMLACALVTLMSLTKNAGFGFPTVDILEGVSLEFSRLLYGMGLLGAGVVCDRDRRFGMVCCAGALITPFLTLSLAGAAAPATIMWALNYFLFGFFSVYRAVLLCDIAERANRLDLAGCGLLFGRVGDALGTALYLALTSSALALIAVATAFFACTIALLFMLYQRLYAPASPEAPSEREVFERFAAQHDLSMREREVLQLLLERRTNAEIAASLYVSESTIKFHVRNLLKKTGCKSRREVLSLYHVGR